MNRDELVLMELRSQKRPVSLGRLRTVTQLNTAELYRALDRLEEKNMVMLINHDVKNDPHNVFVKLKPTS